MHHEKHRKSRGHSHRQPRRMDRYQEEGGGQREQYQARWILDKKKAQEEHQQQHNALCQQARQIVFERTWQLSYGEDWQKVDTICSVDNVCDFWGLFNNVGMPTQSPVKCDFYMFHSGIEPRWESVENVDGGKWNVDLGVCREAADGLWLNLLLGLVGEQFAAGSSDAINGISLHLRPRGVRCSVWTSGKKKVAGDTSAVQAVGDSIRAVGCIPAALPIEFKLHCESIEKGSSFQSAAVMKA